ncbi:hypothetical protein JCM33374_g2739 [Metschnikowia sp. JCM 33374]|nr:hypothetical protein JCM33374_g2739 [Metschnikowia sp. JCM 33374]
MNSGSGDLNLSPKPIKDSFRSPTKSRDSCVSMLSGDSYNPSEIGEAVELSVEEQRINQGPVKHTYMPGNSPDTIDGKQPIEPAGDDVSVFSSSTVLLGRLDTVRNFTKTNNPPEITVETAVESVVPPRSRKRPQSEIITSRSTSRREVSNHRYRFSVDLTDGLDTLMKKASDLTESGEGSLDPPLDNSGSGLGSGSTGRTFSRGSYETADHRSTSDKPTTPLVLPKRPSAKNLDRARKVSLSRAQRQLSDKNHDSDSIADTSVYSTDAVSTSTWHDTNLDRPNALDRPIVLDRSQKNPQYPANSSEYPSSFVGKQPGLDTGVGSRRIPSSSSGRGSNAPSARDRHEDVPRSDADAGGHPWRGPGSVSSNYSWSRSNPSISSKFKPEELRVQRTINESEVPTGGSVSRTRNTGTSVKQKLPKAFADPSASADYSGGHATGHSAGYSADRGADPAADHLHEYPSHESPENTSSSHPSSGPTLQHAGPSEKRQSAQVGTNSSPSTLASPHVTAITEKSPEGHRPTQKLHKKYVSIKKKPESPEKPRQDPDNSQMQVDEDGYYDIEEPVVVSHPARAKSVRDNTRALPRKASKRRSRRNKLRESSDVANLKPFSYNTLVHLLESMNGAVIGEEFETLNLPIQEKQLIEKLIDSLSRLTSDMVLDENRFDIGIQRLEKAHRVLEGFL